MYLCRTNQTTDDDGLSQMQKCRPCEERDGWRKTEIQVQGLRLQLHGGEQVGRAVPRGAQDGLESVFGGTRIQGYREGVGDKLWHGVPMDKEVGEQVELSVGDGCVPVVELDELHSYVQSKKTTDGYGLLLIDLRDSISLLSVGTRVAAPGSGTKSGA